MGLTIPALARSPGLTNSAFYKGNLMSFLLRGDETAGRLSITQGRGRRGTEPPPHVHRSEHEIYYILEGAADFHVEDRAEVMRAAAGDTVLLPAGLAHAVAFTTETFHTLIILLADGADAVGTDAYFRAIAEPATDMAMPAAMHGYAEGTAEELARVAAVAAEHGVVFLRPEEVRRRLPTYPGR